MIGYKWLKVEKRKKIKKLRLTNYVKVLGLSYEPSLFIENGVIKLIEQKEDLNQFSDFTALDVNNCIVAPGFIDPQVNGLNNCTFWMDKLPSFNDIDNLRLELALKGVVAFCPTIITAREDKVLKTIDYLNSYIKQSQDEHGARILGIHLEGIFITKFGVHDSKYVNSELTIKSVEPYIKENVILFTLAPELDLTGKAIKFLQKNNILVSIGHSNASYRQGEIAIKEHGLRTVTHMFNALKGVEGFSHRDGENNSKNLETLKLKIEDEKKIRPDSDGIILSILRNKDVLCMVIADGVHVSPEVLGLLKQYKDKAHFALASDIVQNEFYNLSKSKGTLGGGQITLDKCVSNLVNWKVSNLEDCLTFASESIAKQLKRASELGLGKINFGKEANLVLWDTSKNAVKGTIVGENVFLNY